MVRTPRYARGSRKTSPQTPCRQRGARRMLGSKGRGSLVSRPESVRRIQEVLKGVGLDGLDEVVVEAGLGGAAAVLLLPPPGQRDQDRIAESRVAPQTAGGFVAVHARHADVE